MKRLILVLLWLGLLIPVPGAQRFPPPQFETDYQIPSPTTPGADPAWHDGLDTGVLVGALLLASWLALKKRSRTWIVVLVLFSLVYFGFWRAGCVCPIGAVGNVSMSVFGVDYALPWVVLAFFLAPLIATLFFGRTFCGAVCPLGAVQDLVLLKPIKIPGWLETGLRMVAWTYFSLAVLLAATGSMLLICRYDPFIAFFRLSANSSLLILGLFVVAVGVFIGRPYCRFLCPYGLLLRQCGRLSKWHVTITPDECIHCRLCEDACPFGAIDKPTVDWPEQTLKTDRRRLALLICLLPVLIGLGGWIGYRMHPVLAKLHATVDLAGQVRLQQQGSMEIPTDEIRAFVSSGQSEASLFEEEAAVVSRFAVGSAVMGAFLGMVAGGKLIGGSIRRKRVDYEANRASCFACGRCFAYCPRHRTPKKGSQQGTPSNHKETA